MSERYYFCGRHPRLRLKIPDSVIQENRRAWRKYFLEIYQKPHCEVCDRRLYYSSRNSDHNVHFDHKKKDLPIQGPPYLWYMTHPCTLENKEIWTSCRFGVLCNDCNAMLPTKDRAWVLGEAYNILRGAPCNCNMLIQGLWKQAFYSENSYLRKVIAYLEHNLKE